jgi:predicted nuclease with TOPRIM domain
LNKEKQHLQVKLEEAKSSVEMESNGTVMLLKQIKNLNSDLEVIKDQLKEERLEKSDVQKMFVKANIDVQSWRSRYELDMAAKDEEIEQTKKKMRIKLLAAQEQVCLFYYLLMLTSNLS